MKYLVMETHPAYAVLLDESGRFLKAANLHYQVGDTVQDIIELRPPQTRRRSFGRPLAGIAGLAACLCLAFFGYYQPNFMAYGTLRIQINPDVEMTVSRTERVLGLTGLNGDGQELIAGYSYQGKTRETATDELVERAIEMGYLSDGDTISITCNWSAQILQSLVDFKEQDHPETHDTYRETSIRQNFECIYENQYRLAIIDCFHTLSEMYQERAANTKLEAVVMKERVPAVALMSKHHPLAHQESVTMKEIYAYPLVLFEDYQDPEQHRLLKLQPRQQILYLFDRGSLLDVVQTSNSISILKKNTYVDSAQYGIAELPIRDCPDSYDIVMLKRSYYQMNRREEAFIRYLQAQL